MENMREKMDYCLWEVRKGKRVKVTINILQSVLRGVIGIEESEAMIEDLQEEKDRYLKE